ncbi:terminase large subunit [Telmatobacter bradus]|uniref:terminase large subunit n=1 Tax=Telmatobacter bradus TaxID=474953 RepID=UPI003B429E15
MARVARKRVNSAWVRYAKRAEQYCHDVLEGRITACKWVRLACQRHLDDLERAKGDWEYRFDAERGGGVCSFIECFPHVKGQWALGGHPIKLEDWQVFIICGLFGWISKESGMRRFTEARVIVPRKNGKTALAAGVGLFLFVADGEPGAEVYCGASSEKQANEVFAPASKMARRARFFKEHYGISFGKKTMFVLDEGSKFEIVIGNPGDGPSPHGFIHDEFHEQPTFAQYETAKTGMMARQQPLQLVISTAGVNPESPCHELQNELEKVLDGQIENDRLFCIVYTVDDPYRLVPGPDGTEVPYWTTREAVVEANPNFGVSVIPANILADQRQAVQNANRQNSFLIKHLDIWVNARQAWMNIEACRRCADASLNIADFLHDPCYEGEDLGARIDLTSRCRLFVRNIDGQRHYYAFSTHYVPLDRANDGEHQHYERWVKQGHMVGHPGPEIKLAMVMNDIEADLQRFNHACLAFDPHQAMQMQQELKQRLGDEKVLDIPQRWMYLDPAMKEVEAAVVAGRFHHTGDPVLAWAIGNVVVKPDANENIFPRKENGRINKIDPASALFNAMYPALSAVPPRKSVYATRGLITI